MLLASDLPVEKSLASARACYTETGHAVNRVYGQAKTVGLIADGEFQRCVDVALFLVASHMDVVLAGPAVGESMDQPRVRVEVEDHGLVRCENRLELAVCQSMWVLRIRHQLCQVSDIHKPDLCVGQVLAQQCGGGQGLHRRYVAATRHHDIGFDTLIITGPIPDSQA